MASPTISLCLIAKDEQKNIHRLLDSVEGCFDEIILVDTGSKDKTKELAEQRGCKVYDFEWCDDFSKARNFSFSKATSDYVAWMDLDDCLENKEAFLMWKRHAMQHADMFLATYHYTSDKDGKPVISFVRERVFKRSIEPVWQYPIHEGIIMKPGTKMDQVVSWSVKHMRDAEDMLQDKSRNIKILQNLKDQGKLDTRLEFYYAKELFEAGKPNEALIEFEKVIAKSDLEPHDRLLSYQYGSFSAQSLGDMIKDEAREQKHFWYDKAIELALDGVKKEPMRAEFYVCAGDAFIKKGDLAHALPMYSAAKNCLNLTGHGNVSGPIFSFADNYGKIPTLQMAKIFFNMGRLDDAEGEAKECFDKYDHPEAKQLLEHIAKTKPLCKIDGDQEQTEDIVFTCPPHQAYPFDEEIYKTKGMGGSETALIEMAKWLKIKTGRRVIVFNKKEHEITADSGVEYKKDGIGVGEYFSKYKPKVHIAWRHNIRLTKAPTYLWCHDLITGTCDLVQNFDKMMCLTEFHKQYVIGKQGIEPSKIWLTRNGISPEKFHFDRPEKNPNKLCFMSSPDRGLDGAMLICDEVRKTLPDVTLEVFYGLDNLYKYGLSEMADKLKAMMSERPWVKYHGFVEQSEMYRRVSDCVVLCHPATFIESFCITALEMLALGIFPVTRSLGALANTLAEAEKNQQAVLLDHAAETPEEIKNYADKIIEVIRDQRWSNVSLDLTKHSWNAVADEWIKEMNL